MKTGLQRENIVVGWQVSSRSESAEAHVEGWMFTGTQLGGVQRLSFQLVLFSRRSVSADFLYKQDSCLICARQGVWYKARISQLISNFSLLTHTQTSSTISHACQRRLSSSVICDKFSLSLWRQRWWWESTESTVQPCDLLNKVLYRARTYFEPSTYWLATFGQVGLCTSFFCPFSLFPFLWTLSAPVVLY